MKHLVTRAYAAQRLASYRKIEKRQREEAVRDAWRAAFFLIVVGSLTAAGMLVG